MLRDEDYFCCTGKKPYREKPVPISSLSRRMKGLNFSGKRILISNVKVGHGSELAMSLSRLGADLGLVGRNLKELQSIARKCTGGNTIVLKANLYKNNTAHSVVSKFIAEYGGIDILINLTAIYGHGTIETTSMEQYDKIMNGNVRSLYNLIMRSVPELIDSKGCIINLSLCFGSRGLPNNIVLSISKAAVNQLSRAIAIELGPKGVRCVNISASVVESRYHKNMGMRCGQYITFMRNLRKDHALRRVGKNHELTNVIIYAASNNGKFLTGCDWLVSGGYNILPLTSHNFETYFFPMY